MCGIVGMIDWHRDLRRADGLLAAMTATMAARGPDAEGRWRSERAAFGHRRLSIIDVEGGRQPMLTRRHPGGGDIVLTYSGEVYNFAELRAELTARGHRFESRSDTEVVLRAYVEWGDAVVDRLRGMYAFAIWDADRRQLLLVRDRLGVKPLYFAQTRDGVVFGSEPKALLAHPEVDAEVTADGMAELFAGVSCPTPSAGVLRGIRQVRPGHVVRCGRTGVRESRYWQLTARPHTDDADTTVATVRDLLGEVVREQMVSDVRLGSLLSGGLDSSVVTGLAAQARGGPLDTFSVDFRDDDRHFTAGRLHTGRDAPFARAVAAHHGTRHTEIVLDAADLDGHHDAVVAARDLPGLGDADISLLLLSRQLAQHATVALSGEAADEVFGGYHWFSAEAAGPAGTFPWYREAPAGAGELLHADLRAAIDPADRMAGRYAEARAEVPRLAGEDRLTARMREAGYLYLTRFLPLLLDRKDRMTMAAGVEVRVPFCDHRLVEYVWNVPWRIKNLDGRPKGLLRRVARGLLPDSVLDRRKSAFPAAHDPAYATALRARVAGILADTGSPLRALLDRGRVDALLTGSDRAPATPVGPLRTLGFLAQTDLWMRTHRVRAA